MGDAGSNFAEPAVPVDTSVKGIKRKKTNAKDNGEEDVPLCDDTRPAPLHPELQKEALRMARERSFIVKDEENGRRKLLEVLRVLKERDVDSSDEVVMPYVELLEFPRYSVPWVDPVGAAQSAEGKALPEVDYIPRTLLQERTTDAVCGRGAKELPLVERFPTYSAWSPCPRNEVTEVERTYQGVPALEGLDPKFVREYTKEFAVENVEKRRIKNLLLSDRHIAMLVKNVAEINDPSLVAGEESEVPEKVFEAISEAFGGTEGHPGIMQRYYRAIGEPKEAYLPNLAVATGKPPTVARFLDSCSRLVCNRCYRYDCLEHPFTTDRAPQVFPMAKPVTAEKPCGSECHQKVQLLRDAIRPFSQAEQVIIKAFLTEETDEDAPRQTYCDMAVYSGRPCCETFQVIQELLLVPEDVDFHEIKANARSRNGHARAAKKNNRRNAMFAPAGKKMRQDLKNAGQVKQYQYQPCSHGRGMHCSEKDAEVCNCVDRNTYCERFCACDINCPNRFTGCNCTGDCKTKRCPCFVARRECDPEVCRCQARNARGKCCKNTPILFNSKKKVKCGPSEIHGWGAFIMEDVEEGEFICEYTGEVITQEEAERRGKLYDRVKVSYLFDLNLEYVVDAARKGNKIRYANHSSKNPNCVPEIFRVQGDNRIGIFSKRALKAGEELFFDYSYTAEALKFVQIEQKKQLTNGTSLDPRVASMEQNVDSRIKRPSKTRQGSKNSPVKAGNQAFTFEEVEGSVLGLSATLAFDNEADEAANERELETIAKDFELVDATILKLFSNGTPVREDDVPGVGKSKAHFQQWMNEVYAENFPEYNQACPKRIAGSVWEQLSSLAIAAEAEAEAHRAVAVPALIVDIPVSLPDRVQGARQSTTAPSARQRSAARSSARRNGHV